MNQPVRIFAALLLAGATATSSAAPFVYPAQGQSQEQQNRDEGECLAWARGQTGYDPMQAPAPVYQENERQRGGVLGGAALGAGIGAIADGGDGAGKGAAIGALLGGMRQRSQNVQASRDNDARRAQQQAYESQRRGEFERAYGVCLQGRGYSVN